jgi:hypothetical protein
MYWFKPPLCSNILHVNRGGSNVEIQEITGEAHPAVEEK